MYVCMYADGGCPEVVLLVGVRLLHLDVSHCLIYTVKGPRFEETTTQIVLNRRLLEGYQNDSKHGYKPYPLKSVVFLAASRTSVGWRVLPKIVFALGIPVP